MKIDKKKLKDPAYFIENIIYKPKGWKFTKYQREWCEMILKHKRISIMAFRSSGKSETLLIGIAIWKLCMFPEAQIGIISNSMRQYQKLIKRIKDHFVTNPYLKPFVPTQRTQTWNKQGLDLNNMSQITAYTSNNENIRGEHFDMILLDEVGEYTDHDIFRNAILSTIRAKNGIAVCVGTPKSFYDLLHKLENDPAFSSFHSVRYPAISRETNYFKERYPDQTIEKKEGTIYIYDKEGNVLDTYSSLTWSQEYLLKPLSSEDQIFPTAMIQQCVMNELNFNNEFEPDHFYYVGIDFAMSAQSGSDYTVVTILRRYKTDKTLHLVNMFRWKGLSYEEQMQRIRSILDTYNPTDILVDERSFGVTFLQQLKNEGYLIKGVPFTQKSKEDVIMTLRNQFETKKLRIPNPDTNEELNTRIRVGDIIRELEAFRYVFDETNNKVKMEGVGQHDDCVTSLALAVSAGREKTNGTFVVRARSGVIIR